MSNGYVVNALWKAAGEAVNHQDMEALKDIVNAIDGYFPAKTHQPKSSSRGHRSMNYMAIVDELDKNDSFNKFFSHVGNRPFSPGEFVDWLKSQPETKWIAETHNFDKQLYNVFYNAFKKNDTVKNHSYLRHVIKGAKNGTYYYNPMPSSVLTPLFG